jgi:hypothetical protein
MLGVEAPRENARRGERVSEGKEKRERERRRRRRRESDMWVLVWVVGMKKRYKG